MSDRHAPFFLQGSQEKGVVIFIHGFMGSPRQFDKLAASVHKQGRSAAALLLPGHGGTVKDFSKGTFERWQSHVDAEAERISRDHTHVILAGHSMGGLLAINAAVRQSGKIRGIFTIACPFALNAFSAYAMKIRLKQAFSRKNDPIKSAYLDGSGVPTSPSLMWRTSKPAAEIKILMSAARANLPLLRAPVYAVYSVSDELTSIASLDIFKEELTGAPFEHLLLSESLHAYFPDHEQIMIERALSDFTTTSMAL